MQTDEQRKVPAACADCGRVFAAVVSPDGSVRFIGRPDGCRCGGSDVVLPSDRE